MRKSSLRRLQRQEEFREYYQTLAEESGLEQIDQFPQHGTTTRLTHSMAVAYLPDGACRKADRAVRLLLPTPDVAVLVDVEPETAIGRIFDRGDELEMFETVERLTAIRGRMIGISEGWVVLDNNGGPEGLADGIRSKVLGRS